MDWTDGYVQGIDYTHGYYPELAPGLLTLACASRGVSTRLEHPSPRYLELGFGQGVSIGIHAAACVGEFWGNDVNPAHVANARELSAASGSDAHLSDDSFKSLAAREDLPEFDAITLHGVWSWISAGNRRTILDLVRRKLAPGGVFYLSYNCLPGWAAERPLRHLMALHAELAGTALPGMQAQIDAARTFAQSLQECGAKYFDAHTSLKRRMESLPGDTHAYLAHEYFNRDWQPMDFAEVAGALAEAKLDFVATAMLDEHSDDLGLPDEACQLLSGIAHPVMRETARDYVVNRKLRRDIFVKGARSMPAAARAERLGGTPFALLVHPGQVPGKITIAGYEVELSQAIYEPLLKALAADDHAPKTLQELGERPEFRRITTAQLQQAAMLLTGIGSAHPVQARAAQEAAAPRCKALNARILEHAAEGREVCALASPVIGAGVFVSREDMLFLRAIQNGITAPKAWAQLAWECLLKNDKRVVVGGRTIEGAEDNLAYLVAEAKALAQLRLPVMQALGIT